MPKKVTTPEFIAKARAIHGDKYDYSKVVYVNAKTKVCIICPEHGEFWQTPTNHLFTKGCPTCGKIKNAEGKKKFHKSQRPDLSHIKTPEGSKAVPLGIKGKYVIVDVEDYETVTEHNWSLGGNGYAANNSVGLMHRFIMNPPEGMYIDHKDGDKLNNRKANLRVCTQRENLFNIESFGGSSRYKGVGWHKKANRWRAFIGSDGKQKHIGLFDNEIEAAKAYDEAAKEIQGKFARLNFQ